MMEQGKTKSVIVKIEYHGPATYDFERKNNQDGCTAKRGKNKGRGKSTKRKAEVGNDSLNQSAGVNCPTSAIKTNFPSVIRMPNSYSQFETPADETRTNYGPEDFDEELFTQQLDNSCQQPHQFDEELESDNGNANGEHSDGSDIDIEENYEILDSSKKSSCSSESSSYSSSCSNFNSYPKTNHVDTITCITHNDLNSNGRNFLNCVHGTLNRTEPENDEYELNRESGSSGRIDGLIRKRKVEDLNEECYGILPHKKTAADNAFHHRNASSEKSKNQGGELPGTSSSILESRLEKPLLMDEWLNTFLSWSHSKRLTSINELIDICEPTEIRHMMQVIEPRFQRDFISLLPKELALYVLTFLEPKDLLRAAQTCRYWRILADDNLLWREKCREAGIGYFSAMSHRVQRKSHGNNNVRIRSNPDYKLYSKTQWKQAYLRQHNVEMNWRCRPLKAPKVLKGHDEHVITCLQFSGNRIVSGSDDNSLKVWSAISGKCLRTLQGHTGGVWSSQMSGSVIVSGSTDRTLRVWNADNGNCIHTLYGHTSTVRCMHLEGKKVVSGSRDATLRMWDVETGECLHVLVGHMAAVRCVQYNGRLVVSGAYDYVVRVWDPETEECLHQLTGHNNRVYSLQFDGVHVVSGSLDTSIRVWDVETGTCKHTLMGHQSLTSGMELRDNILVSGNADSTVKIWDITTGQCLLTLQGVNKHVSAVTCLQLINKFVITSSDDGTVKLWDIKTGEFVRNLVTLDSGGSGGVVWRIRSSDTKLVCAVGSRNGTEETKLLVLDFEVDVN